MITLSKRFTDVPWFGSALTLANLPATTKAKIRQITKLSANGGGRISWSPTAGINALTSVTTGDQLIVDAADFSTPFSIDNGTAPTTGGDVPSPRDFKLFGQSGVPETPSTEVGIDRKFTASDEVFITGAGTVTYRLNGTGEYLSASAFNSAMQNATAVSSFSWKVVHSGAFEMKFTATYL